MTEPSGPAPELSIIVPLYNEEQNVPPLYERLHAALEQLGRSYEIVLVNDGSRDRTQELIEQLAERDPRVVAVTFRRNFGQTAALAGGIDHSRGAILVPMDGDLQNDPADIGRLLDKLAEGYDVVSGWRKDRHDSILRVIPSRIANGIISRVGGVRLHDYGCTLKAYRREVLEGVHLYGEMHRFIPIYASWQGARVAELPVAHHARQHGKSHYGFERTVKVLLDLIVVKFFAAYLTKPIYVFGGFGIVSLCLSLVAFAAALAFKLIPPDNPWGEHWHKDFVSTPLPVLAVGLFVIGLQMILIGLLAEMLIRTYYESQHKTTYLVKNVKRKG
jgi:glycosyltransferase involved in cell wall biosynthesis